MKKRILKLTGILIIVCLLLNLMWFGWRHASYDSYRNEMTKTELSTLWHLTYVAQDADGFEYNVSYPAYPSFTGNLAVGYPATAQNPFSDGLIIWPQLFGGYEYGIILNPKENENQGYMFYIDAKGNAVDEEYREVAEENQDIIQELLRRAGTRWAL